MTLVITSCTNRKRQPVSPDLHMSSLSPAPLDELVSHWSERLERETRRHPASDVYGGRSFQEARATAAKLGAKLVVVSAGLGLIEASTPVPSYGCTVMVGADDGVRSRVPDAFSIASWWRAVSKASCFSLSLEDLVRDHPGPLLIALSQTYLDMLTPDLMALPAEHLVRVRIFTGSPIDRTPEALRPYRMPYDHRLDGPDSPLQGTGNDFASRALAHFVTMGCGRVPQSFLAEDVKAVASEIASWREPKKFDRKRYDDKEMRKFIEQYWESAGGSASRLLRYFRDELDIACEQSRFAALARQVRDGRI